MSGVRPSGPVPCDSNLSSSTYAEELDADEFVDVDDDVDDQEAGASEDEVESAASVLTAGASGRVFMVERVQKATGGHRPNMLFDGRLMEIVPFGAGHRLQHVESSKELSLSLRYEPPSPKFSRSCPDMTSYRLKLLQGTQFIYLLRGLPRVLVLDQAARAVGWGALQLVFATSQQLDCFLAVLRHVSIVSDQLWPRHIASLWRPTLSEPGTQQPTAQQPTINATASNQQPREENAVGSAGQWPAAFLDREGQSVSTGMGSGCDSGSGSHGTCTAAGAANSLHVKADGRMPVAVKVAAYAEKLQGMEREGLSGRGRGGSGATDAWRSWQACVDWAGAHPHVVGGVVVAALAAGVVLAMRGHRSHFSVQ